jgi:hypothetical protein
VDEIRMEAEADLAAKAIIEYELATCREAEIDNDGTLSVVRQDGSLFRAAGLGELLIASVLAEAESALQR